MTALPVIPIPHFMYGALEIMSSNRYQTCKQSGFDSHTLRSCSKPDLHSGSAKLGTVQKTRRTPSQIIQQPAGANLAMRQRRFFAKDVPEFRKFISYINSISWKVSPLYCVHFIHILVKTGHKNMTCFSHMDGSDTTTAQGWKHHRCFTFRLTTPVVLIKQNLVRGIFVTV
jgi:hypothetical protein